MARTTDRELAEAYDAGVDSVKDALEVLYKAALAVEWTGPDYVSAADTAPALAVHSCPYCRARCGFGPSPVHRDGCGLREAIRLVAAVLNPEPLPPVEPEREQYAPDPDPPLDRCCAPHPELPGFFCAVPAEHELAGQGHNYWRFSPRESEIARAFHPRPIEEALRAAGMDATEVRRAGVDPLDLERLWSALRLARASRPKAPTTGAADE